jgi:hypothetical protein
MCRYATIETSILANTNVNANIALFNVKTFCRRRVIAIEITIIIMLLFVSDGVSLDTNVNFLKS